MKNFEIEKYFYEKVKDCFFLKILVKLIQVNENILINWNFVNLH